MSTFNLVVATAGIVTWIAVYRAVKLWSQTRGYKHVPRYYVLVDPLNPLCFLLPTSSWNPRLNQAWNERKNLYADYKTEVLLYVPLLTGNVILHCASPEACRQILSDAFQFPKPQRVLALNFLGPNVVASVGEQWRRHRKITAPAFDNQSYANVWEVTARLYQQMMTSEAWKSGNEAYFSSINQVTTRLALLVISACGFNMSMRWDESPVRKELSEPVDTTIMTVSKSVVAKIMLPDWVMRLPVKSLQRIQIAFADLERFLHSEIVAKRAALQNDIQFDGELNPANSTIFGRLVTASQQKDTVGLDDREIAGNLFIFFFAGHETTAHTLVVALALLAIHTEDQERIHQHIISVVGDSEPTYEDYNALSPVLHCFYEAVRLYPGAYVMLRTPYEDTAVSAPHLTPTSDTIVIPEGSDIILDVIGATGNERHYPEASTFKPTRWETPAALDNFLGFSSGPRVCLGRKFATVEGVCFLTYLLREWQVGLKLRANETPEMWRQKYLQPVLGATLKLDDVPLIFTRRNARGN